MTHLFDSQIVNLSISLNGSYETKGLELRNKPSPSTWGSLSGVSPCAPDLGQDTSAVYSCMLINLGHIYWSAYLGLTSK